MSAALLGTYEAPPAPLPVRGLRRVLLATAVLTTLTALASLSLGPLTTDRLGEALWGLVPALVALALARRTATAGRGVLVGVVALAVVMALLALARLAVGELQGLTNLLLPAAMLALVLHPGTRAHLATGPGPDVARRPRARRLALFRRGPVGDGGQLAVESIGILAVAALVIGLATAAVMAAPVDEGTEEIVCSIQDSQSCSYDSGLDDSRGSGGGGGGSAPDDDAPWCTSIGDCALRALGQAMSLQWQIVDAAIDDIVGVFELLTMDPSQLLDALQYLLENPGDAIWALVWDAESRALWAAGDYGGAMGRVVWNVGSMFIPFVNAGKVAAALGDLGRLSRVAAGADELADLATAAQRAQDAARLGNLDDAADIAADARRYADDLDARARAAGCVAAGPLDLQVLALGGGRSTAGVVVVAGGGLCDAAGEAARQADEAAKAADEAVDDGLRDAATPPAGAIPEGLDRGELGWDPAVGRFRPNEYETALKIEEAQGVTLRRAEGGSADWVDADGRTYDAVGPFQSQFFDQQWPTFQDRMVDHLDKADVVPVDVSMFTPAQVAQVRDYIDSLPPAQRDRLVVIGG